MRKILADLRVLRLEKDEKWIVTINDRYYSITRDTATLLDILKNHPGQSASFYATQVAAKLGYDIAPDEIVKGIAALPESFFEQTPIIPKEYRLSLPILRQRILEPITECFSFLFKPAVMVFMFSLSCILVLLSMLSNRPQAANTTLTGCVVLFSILFHELGHASACRAVGARVGSIGVGIRNIVPSFYTDVTDVWTRNRHARMVVDAGGIYFQLIFAGVVGALSLLSPELHRALILILMLIAFSSLPYYKFDGYWLLTDFLGQGNLATWLKQSVKHLLQKANSGKFHVRDVKKAIGILAYGVGFVLLHAWIMYSGYRMLNSALTAISNKLPSDIRHSSNASTILLHAPSMLAPASIATLLVISLTRQILRNTDLKDGILIIRTFLKIGLLRLLVPFLHLSLKHKNYLEDVEAGLRRSNVRNIDIKRIAKRTLISKYYELFWYDLLSKVNTRTGMWLVKKTHHTTSRETFENIGSLSGGVIVIAPHYGSFISGALYMLNQLKGKRRVHVFYADPKTDPANAAYEPFYRRYFPDLSVCFDNRGGVVQAAKALQAGDIVAIMPDVFSGKNMVDIELLGQEISVRPGISYFHRKFDAHLIPVVSNFDGLFSVNVHIGNAIESCATVPGEAVTDAYVMGRIFSYFEKWFTSHPHHWHCWERFGTLSRHPSDKTTQAL